MVYVFIVVDAIRNPYAARFFRDRYSVFYLVIINALSKDRSKYLKNTRKFTVDQIDKIEHKEFMGQNVKKCIEVSGIHLFNPRNEINHHNVLRP